MAAPEATDGVELDGEVAFEAEDAVMFEAAFDDAPMVEADSVDARRRQLAASEPTSPTLDAGRRQSDADAVRTRRLDDSSTTPAAVPATDDRVLLQFAATVPHDLAELRRIAADNQW